MGIIAGFDIVWTRKKEDGSQAVYAKHRKTGLEVYHLHNDDPENLFSYAFSTACESSTGVAHIMEHSVLCGSQHYPLKDPFVVLSQQSVKTFLNAMTAPDKTMYPAATTVESDYFNLMKVYGDAVFFPLLKKWTFCQEGHRLMLDEQDTPRLQGVVLNEMRGVYADFNYVAYTHLKNTLLQNTVYAYESGGFPLDIVELTYEDFCNFHRRHYHPANCKLFLYGNIPTEKQLAFLDAELLSLIETEGSECAIPLAQPVSHPVTATGDAPATEDMDESKVAVLRGWVLPTADNLSNIMRAYFLEEILFGHDGTRFAKALQDCPYAADVYAYNGCQLDAQHIFFAIGLTDIDEQDIEKATEYIDTALQHLVEEPLSDEALETALHSMEFANKEIKRSGGSPFSLTLMQRSLRGWMYGKGPEATLDYSSGFNQLKKDLSEKSYSPASLITAAFLQNPQQATVIVRRDRGYCQKLDEALQKKAEQKAGQLSSSERTEHYAFQKNLQEIQNAPDSVEHKKLIPHLKKEDLPLPPPCGKECITHINTMPAIIHERKTNDIAYLQIALPVDMLSVDEAQYLPLYASLLTAMNTPKHSWDAVASAFARYTGNFTVGTVVLPDSSANSTNHDLPDMQKALVGRAWLSIQAKFLPDMIDSALAFLSEYLNTVQFSDTERIKDVLTATKNETDSLAGLAGHTLTLASSAAGLSAVKSVDELWNGITQILFLRSLYQKKDTPEFLHTLGKKLSAIHQKIMHHGAILRLCGTESNLSTLTSAIKKHLHFTAPLPPGSLLRESFAQFHTNSRLDLYPAQVQVGFATLTLAPFLLEPKHQGTQTVFARWLAGEPFWKKIRTIGGAYGAFTIPDLPNALLSCITYRDPQPLNSLNTMITTIREVNNEPFSPSALEPFIVGSYSTVLSPKTPNQESSIAFIRYLSGLTEEDRITHIEGILSTTPKTMHECADHLCSLLPTSNASIIGSPAMLTHESQAHHEPYHHLFPHPTHHQVL